MALRVLLALTAALCARADPPAHRLCSLDYCECKPGGHPQWTTVNCTVPPNQKLDIFEGDLPATTTDLMVHGADALLFAENSLSRLSDARFIKITGSRLVLVRKFAAVNLNILSLYVDVDGSDVLRVEDNAFANIKGPLTVQITNCQYVSLDKEAFSWLLGITISDVHQLKLSPGTFVLDPTAANVGAHGPGLTIELKNLAIPEIMSQTFGSSAAVVSMRNVEVDVIRGDAFSANTYNVVMAENSSFYKIQSKAFAQKSMILNFKMVGCKVHQWASGAFQSAIAALNISSCLFEYIKTEAINATVARATILDTKFEHVAEKGIELRSWTKLQMERNTFDYLGANGILAPGSPTSSHELVFIENAIDKSFENSLGFVGKTKGNYADTVVYANNFFGESCHCNMTLWLKSRLSSGSGETFTSDSYCTLDEVFARCFNIPDQNMIVDSFFKNVCGKEMVIQCEAYRKVEDGQTPQLKNPRFPNKGEYVGVLSEKNKKVLGIVVVTILGCVLIVMLISLIRWMKRRGYGSTNNCVAPENCCSIFSRVFSCGNNNGIGNAASISHISIHDYSERRRLNEPRIPEFLIQETRLDEMAIDNPLATADKVTQTLPEELTKELLENLKEKLEDPEDYLEAREMIEHLYELIKVEEACNDENPPPRYTDENIYDLPFVNTAPRRGKNNKTMVSVGTRTPSLDNLLPLSPYYRKTSLAHEYFEPKDFAVHLYAEIMNNDREKNNLLNGMPDVVAEQVTPRGPYLRAVCEKKTSPNGRPVNGVSRLASPQHTSSMKSNRSTSSNSPAMVNRPLPDKPINFDPGEGTSSHMVKSA